MPRRQFNADLAAAAANSYDRISQVKKGESDGEVIVTYVHEDLEVAVPVRLVCQDVDSYPHTGGFIVYTDFEDAPAALVTSMTDIQDYSMGSNIHEMISTVTKVFTKELRLSTEDDDLEMTDAEQGPDDDGEDEGRDTWDSDEDIYDHEDEFFGLTPSLNFGSTKNFINTDVAKQLNKRIKQDLRLVRSAGFRVGILSGMESAATTHIVSMSVRASKLGLSDEALFTWGIARDEYVVLLFRLSGSYQTFEETIASPASNTQVTFRIGKCTRYKPGLSQALKAYSDLNRQHDMTNKTTREPDMGSDQGQHGLTKILVSNSLNLFMNEHFISLMKIREAKGLSWDDANTYLLDDIGLMDNAPVRKTPAESVTPGDCLLPDVLRHDHLSEDGDGNRSMPLVAMQFAMRYFTQCTKYCLRCHRKLDCEFESLKPYVCNNPLCLFQYMAMGFGPNIELEILSHPVVVDLLVSFCYSAVAFSRPPRQFGLNGSTEHSIREYPVGLQFKVPDSEAKGIRGQVSWETAEFKLDDAEHLNRLHVGQWVAIRLVEVKPPGPPPPAPTLQPRSTTPSLNTTVGALPALYHAKIERLDFFTKVVGVAYMSGAKPDTSAGNAAVAADLLPYEKSLDDVLQKAQVMANILGTLPRIADIKQYLETHPYCNLRSMDRVSPAAAAILEWIVASNRSCIFHMEPSAAQDHVLGMQGWTQFRFAQGAPDKDLRFSKALQEVKARKKLKCPTFFAWHGSTLANWHSIVRTGLDYSIMSNGRAYGDGVYFSSLFSVSSGYSGTYTPLYAPWPHSDLNITAAISLNEIINAPDEFRSRDPHYVVAQKDWHQCRFLFVKCSIPQGATDDSQTPAVDPGPAKGSSKKEKPELKDPSVKYLCQDGARAAMGPHSTKVEIPLAVLPSARLSAKGYSAKAAELDNGDGADESLDEDDPQDVRFLLSEDEADSEEQDDSHSAFSSVDTVTACEMTAERLPTPTTADYPVTEFQPGSLDLSKLPRLQPPSWATNTALKNISKEVKKLQKIQKKTPPRELGWYIDFEGLENVFQWIVELHSFDLELPLAQDMQKAGASSIVCEIRFGPQFPYSPPFVRIVRPRFLPFMNGGGGHVTLGGAMCMELLTNSGWSPANSVEAVLLQIRLALCSLDPRPARLETGAPLGDYAIGEAVDSYRRAAATHGWKVPDDLYQTAVETAKP